MSREIIFYSEAKKKISDSLDDRSELKYTGLDSNQLCFLQKMDYESIAFNHSATGAKNKHKITRILLLFLYAKSKNKLMLVKRLELLTP